MPPFADQFQLFVWKLAGRAGRSLLHRRREIERRAQAEGAARAATRAIGHGVDC